MNPIAFLTCELKARDLDSRLLLAAHLLHRGIAVVFGQQWSIWSNLQKLPAGCLVATGGSSVHAANMARFKAAGHAVVMSDEEALALVSAPHLVANVVPAAMDSCDLFMAQSPTHAQVIADAFPAYGVDGFEDRIRVTGNARCDLLTPRGRAAFAAEAKTFCGGNRYILFNSNFALEHFLWCDIDDVAPDAAHERGLRIDMLDWERENKRELIALIRWAVANLPDHQFVIRPHPAERANAWTKLRDISSRIRIIEGSVPVPWLMGADVVVHTNCTTGLEAAMLGVPTINLSPDPDAEWHKAFITPEVNTTVALAADAAYPLYAIVNRSFPPLVFPERIEAHLPQWETVCAAGNVAAEIQQLTGCGGDHSFATGIKFGAPAPDTEPYRHKFTIGRSEIEDRLARIAEAFGLCADVAIGTKQLDESVVLMVRR